VPRGTRTRAPLLVVTLAIVQVLHALLPLFFGLFRAQQLPSIVVAPLGWLPAQLVQRLRHLVELLERLTVLLLLSRLIALVLEQAANVVAAAIRPNHSLLHGC